MLHEHKIKCNKCGNKLSVEYGHHNIVYINPCEICLKNEKEIIDSHRCVWTLCEDDPTYGKTLQLECDKGKYHPYFLLRLDKYPFCPCCGKQIEVKEVKDAG